jgi:hypothetical protein
VGTLGKEANEIYSQRMNYSIERSPEGTFSLFTNEELQVEGIT